MATLRKVTKRKRKQREELVVPIRKKVSKRTWKAPQPQRG